MDISQFSLRNVNNKASNLPAKALDGGLRVHIPTKHLTSAALRHGEYCQLDQTDGRPKAIGVAWLAKDPGQGTKRMAFIEEPMKELFGVRLEDKVTITKLEPQELQPAQKIYIKEVEPGSSNTSKAEIEWFAKYALCSVDMVLPGGTFAATVSRGPRPGIKNRYMVERVEPPTEEPLIPYVCNAATEVQLLSKDEVVEVAEAEPREAPVFKVNSDGIGGLHKQILELNERLANITNELRRRKYPYLLKRATGVLLYGPEGTGKSLLLRKLSEAPWRKVITVDEPLGSTAEKSQSALRKCFEEAKAAQPSIIVFDKLEAFAPRTDENGASKSSLARCIAAEMQKLETARVLVVGATTRLVDVDASLRTPELFADEIEVPVPDAKARIEILKVLQEKEWPVSDQTAENIGGRTHGFVGRDLAALYKKALKRACDKYFEQDSRNEPNGAITSLDAEQQQHGPEQGEPGESNQIATAVSLADFEDALLQVRPTAMNEVFLETPKVRWSDIGGSDSVKAALQEVTEWPFKYAEHMQELDLQPQRGILLYGPPGCSKTLCAKAVATESDLNFLAVKGAELTSMYVGETERAVREVFRKARAASPSIIFFDEIDSIAASRESGKQLSGLNVLTTLLNEMDGIESLKGVLVLAATNRPDVLDSALMRPGRFDAILYVGPPNIEARLAILNIRLVENGRPLADDVDLQELATLTEGYSGAEIVEICSEAARTTLRDRLRHGDKRCIGMGHFRRALDKVPRRISREMTEQYENWSVDDAIKRL
ncbi:ATPase family gene 2 protein [Lasiodiplodia theobromae]|uniref:ATPase family gene 2 protein n=1 Tax=Lasiodiplodia theobromae TaxID=45133 RepID=A0A5N5DFJ0_9PEZI|nr:ATPase family gene 2 protein [Lasiodiplodia theobromae]